MYACYWGRILLVCHEVREGEGTTETRQTGKQESEMEMEMEGMNEWDSNEGAENS